MNEYLDHLSANDNDIYDLLISGKQRMTVSVLRELLRDRGIFCSAKDEREDICDYISMIPHGFHDIEAIVDKREPPGRRDKTTNIQFDSEIALDDIREAVESYMKTIGPNEEVRGRHSQH